MKIKKIDWQPLVKIARAELDLVVSTVRDKGPKRFGKAFGLAGLCTALAYFGIYRHAQTKITNLAQEIEKVKAMSEVGTQYKEIHDQLGAAYAILPQMGDRDQWLSNTMMDALRTKSLTPDSVKPVSETEANGLIFQTSTVDLTLRFEELYLFLLRLESNKPLMHIHSLDLQKKSEQLGMNTAVVSVMTVIPKKRLN